MKKQLTRTQADPHYAAVNRNVMHRSYFCKSAAWRYIKLHHLDVADVIRAEAHKRWPSPKPLATEEFAFLADLDEKEKRR